MNATKHGERSADRIAARQEVCELLRAVRQMDRADDQAPQIEAGEGDSIRLWLDRIAGELGR